MVCLGFTLKKDTAQTFLSFDPVFSTFELSVNSYYQMEGIGE